MKKRNLFLFFTIAAGLLLAYSPQIFLQKAQAAASISGRVFQDYNGNGQFDAVTTVGNPAAVDRGVSGVTVRAYDKNDALQGSAQTIADGTYSLTAGGTGPYRVEFTDFPAYKPSARSTDSVNGGTSANTGSSIQFVADGTTSNVNLAINKPLDYCQNNPTLATTCFTGTVSGNTADPVLISFPYNSGTISTTDSAGVTNGVHNLMIPQSTLGSISGLAYHRSSRKIFAGAFTKRHAGFRNNNKNTANNDPTGEIFISNRTGTDGTAASLFLNLNTLFGSNVAGANPHDTANYGSDTTAFDAVGKTALGDVELSEDEQTLYAVNLADRKLYAIPLGAGTPVAPTASTQITTYDLRNLAGIAASVCPAADLRPGALKVFGGKVYFGLTCTAQSSGDASKLRAFVYELNTAGAGSAAQAADIPLTYPRGAVSRDGSTSAPATWKPWISSTASLLDGPFGQKYYPQPWLLDIEFDERNFMVIGLSDRVGHQLGNDNDGANTGTVEGVSGGDTLRLSPSGATWTLESNGSDGTNITSGAGNNQGPGGGEFYYQDQYFLSGTGTHDEITLGNLLIVPGYRDVVSSAFDPAPTGTLNGQNTYRAGGIVWMSNFDGKRTRSYQLFSIDAPNTFGKASGVGDIEAMCNLAPLEIGNRVWRDTNRNGVQDAGENGISGVTVRLYNGSTQLTGTSNYRDEFSAVAYNGSNGTINWNGSPWTEINDDNAAATGNVGVVASGGSYGNTPYLNNTNTGLSRSINLAGSNSATLSFVYFRQASQGASVQYLANNTWTNLQSFPAGTDVSAQTATVNLPTTATAIRFLNAAGNAANNIFYFDNVNINVVRNAVVVTDANGEYYFSSATGTNTANAFYGMNILPNTNYQIRLDNPADYSVSSNGALAGVELTTRNQTAQNGFKQGTDSDAAMASNPAGSPSGNYPVIGMTTGTAGDNNHTFDFGFANVPTAAPADVSGRVFTSKNRRGAARVIVSLQNAETGERFITLTNQFGYFRFDGVPTGFSYILTVSGKRSKSSQTEHFQLNGSRSDLVFYLDSGFSGKFGN